VAKMGELKNSDIYLDSKGQKPKKSVLVIDDNQDCLFLNKTILEIEGFEVFTASCGKDALAALSGIDPPGLILLDMRMPDMTGTEFLEIFEKQKPEIFEKVPVVFLTAMDEVPASKAVGFIRKPMKCEKFLAQVHQYIDLGVEHSVFKH
jgi:CheY-like chemotaxis protein